MESLAFAALLFLSAGNGTSATPGASASLERADSIVVLRNGLEARSGKSILEINALRDEVLRIRVGPTGSLPEDASWAVPQGVRKAAVRVEAIHAQNAAGFRTQALDVRLERNPMRLVIRDLHGTVMCSDAPGHAISFRQGSFRVWKELQGDEHFFGLGDKTGPLDRRDQAFSMWNTDAYGFQESTDPIYKTIPFFLATRAGVGVWNLSGQYVAHQL